MFMHNMVLERIDRGRLSYQLVLRQIGAWLDERVPDRVAVIETPDGFSVRAQWGHDARASIVRHFTSEELLALHRTAARMRASLPTGAAARRLAASQKTGYHDAFRTLGYELDQVPAYSVLLDELDAGFLVTYQYQHPRQLSIWHKHMAVVTVEEQGKLIKEAHRRRQPPIGLSARLSRI